MKSKWLHRKNGAKLIFFCNGWGMDETPFAYLNSYGWDVRMVYDYTDLNVKQNFEELFGMYDEVIVVAWSMGVWIGQQIFAPFKSKISAALAINGTLCPIDDQFGIPEKIVKATLAHFDIKQRLNFYYRMCRDRDVYRRFLKHQPVRTINNQKYELNHLLEISTCSEPTDSIYTCAVIADQDYVMPTANQLKFWPEQMTQLLAGTHFLFYRYESWDEIAATVYKGKNGL